MESLNSLHRINSLTHLSHVATVGSRLFHNSCAAIAARACVCVELMLINALQARRLQKPKNQRIFRAICHTGNAQFSFGVLETGEWEYAAKGPFVEEATTKRMYRFGQVYRPKTRSWDGGGSLFHSYKEFLAGSSDGVSNWHPDRPT